LTPEKPHKQHVKARSKNKRGNEISRVFGNASVLSGGEGGAQEEEAVLSSRNAQET